LDRHNSRVNLHDLLKCQRYLVVGYWSAGNYLFTYSVELSPSWEANWFYSYSRNSPHFMEPEGSSPYPQLPATCPCPEPTPFPTTLSHFLKIHLNIILPSTPGSPQWSLSPRFPHQNPVHNSPLPHTRHMPRPSHSSRFYHPHNIGKEYRSLKCSYVCLL
jgi:hypothetical protein